VGTALAVFGVLTGVGISQAYWSDNATVTGTINVTSANPALAVSGLGAVVFTGQSSYISTLTLKNTGDQTLSSFTAALATGSTTGSDYDANLAAHIAVTVWPMPTSGVCGAPPSGSPSGTWATWPTSPFPGLTLAAGSTAQYCVLSTWDGTTTPSKQIYPSLTVNASSPGGPASGNNALALQAVAPITVTPSQVGVTSTDSVDTTVGSAGILTTNYQSGQNTDIADPGTIVSISNFCTKLSVIGSGASHDWSIKIDATKPPYYGANLETQAHFNTTGQSSVVSGYAHHLAGDPAGTYTLTGVGPVSASHPFDSVDLASTPNVIYNTPIAAGQTADVMFCLDNQNNPPAPVLAADPTTYAITMQPRIVSCSANNYGSALQNSTTVNTTLPSASNVANGNDVCFALQLTGYYPHFYVGWTYSLNWHDLVYQYLTSSTAAQKDAIVSKGLTCNLQQFFKHTVPVTGQNTDHGQYSNNPGNQYSINVTGSGTSKAITVSFWGVTDSTGGITNNMIITSFGQAC
jgi:hypothetical protein